MWGTAKADIKLRNNLYNKVIMKLASDFHVRLDALIRRDYQRTFCCIKFEYNTKCI